MNLSPVEPPLLEVFFLHHREDSTATARAEALRLAFLAGSGVRRSPFRESVDPWTLVSFHAEADPAALTERLKTAGRRAVFVILVTEKLAADASWEAPLQRIAAALPAAGAVHRWNALVYAASEEALRKLPPSLKPFQAKEVAHIHSESAFRPHVLALLALHRARLVLGSTPAQNKLRFFISHAKADGLFLAHSLKSLILGVPEMEKWYDADDIASGDEWTEEIQEAAGGSVFIAVRTEAYDQREWCCREFQAALTAGVPIVVVDALLGPAIRPSALPFADMPTVRIPDGNTHRVLTTALREHLRLLLLETLVEEKAAPALAGAAWRVWPRLPTLASYARLGAPAPVPVQHFWLVADAPDVEAEFLDLQARLARTLPLRLEILSNFLAAQSFAVSA